MLTKQQLLFYIKADRIMNTGTNKKSFFKSLFYPNYILKYLELLRKCEYWQSHNPVIFNYYYMRYLKLGCKLGITIDLNVFGYGLVIPHHGTIVVGGGNKIGNYCVLHTSVCITAGMKTIGNGFYVSTGAKILKDITVSDNVSVAANSVLRNSVEQSNLLVGGIPAKIIKSTEAWYIRDGEKYYKRVEKVESMREMLPKQFLNNTYQGE